MKTKLLDLGTSDVHTPGAGKFRPGSTPTMKNVKPINAANRRRKHAAKMPPSRGLRMAITHPDGTHTVIRHMTDTVCMRLADGGRWVPFHGIEIDPAVALDASDQAKPVWIQIAKSGSFFKGDHFELNDRVFDEIIRNFEATSNHEVPVDFEHASEQSPSEGTIPTEGAPAQGWVKQLRTQGGNLYGLVEWGQLARDYIKGKKYRYISPAIVLNARDRNTGKPIGARLTSVALTNKPFLDGMLPVAAKDDHMTTSATVALAERCCMSAGQYMPQIKAALRVHDLTTAEELADHVGRLREHLDAVDGDGSATHEGLKLDDYLGPLRSLANVPASASWYDVLDVIDKLVKWGFGEHLEENQGDPTAEMSGDNDDTELNMNDQQLSVQLGEEKARVKTLTDQLEAEKATAATLGLQLKDATSKLAERDASIKTIADERDALKKQLSDRDEKARTDRVEEAFSTWKDKKNLTDDDKVAMRITLTHAPETFEKLYPRVPAGQVHLVRTLTEGGDKGRGGEPPAAASMNGEPAAKTMSIGDVAKQIMRERGCDYGTALVLAERAVAKK